MTPAARAAAAIGILDRILAGTPAEQALTGWARASRYAGSGDRGAVRDLVFDTLRSRRSLCALSGQAEESGRALMIGLAVREGRAIAALFSGAPHAPMPLTAIEAAELAAAPRLALAPTGVRLDMPDWLMPRLEASLGQETEPVLAALTTRAPVFLRANGRKTTPEAAILRLSVDGVCASPVGDVPGALLATEGASKIRASEAYLEGVIELQDLSSQAAVRMLDLRPGMTILDYCAGGGGKTLAMAGRVDARFTAHDADPRRMVDLPTRARRAGVRVEIADEAALSGRTFDLVLVDAPCSGSGTWRRSPDAKWRLTESRLGELTALQDRILDSAATLVAPGGRLAYMTCSLLDEENGARIAAFCQSHPAFAPGWSRQFLPLSGGDGFFAAQLSRA